MHDERREDPGLAFQLRLSRGPYEPTPIGVFRAVDRTEYGAAMNEQLEEARRRSGTGDLDVLLGPRGPGPSAKPTPGDLSLVNLARVTQLCGPRSTQSPDKHHQRARCARDCTDDRQRVTAAGCDRSDRYYEQSKHPGEGERPQIAARHRPASGTSEYLITLEAVRLTNHGWINRSICAGPEDATVDQRIIPGGGMCTRATRAGPLSARGLRSSGVEAPIDHPGPRLRVEVGRLRRHEPALPRPVADLGDRHRPDQDRDLGLVTLDCPPASCQSWTYLTATSGIASVTSVTRLEFEVGSCHLIGLRTWRQEPDGV